MPGQQWFAHALLEGKADEPPCYVQPFEKGVAEGSWLHAPMQPQKAVDSMWHSIWSVPLCLGLTGLLPSSAKHVEILAISYHWPMFRYFYVAATRFCVAHKSMALWFLFTLKQSNCFFYHLSEFGSGSYDVNWAGWPKYVKGYCCWNWNSHGFCMFGYHLVKFVMFLDVHSSAQNWVYIQ